MRSVLLPSSPRRASCDVLGFGCVAVDDLCYVSSYPPANAKIPVLRERRQFGGLIGTALIAAARLGAKCAYAGSFGEDNLSAYAMESLRAEGIRLSGVERNPKARPVHSFIVVDERGGRNVFYDPSGMIPRRRNAPLEEAVRSARVLLIDDYDAKAKLRAVRFARQGGIPVVADFELGTEPGFAELLGVVDHLILSHDFAARLVPDASPEEMALRLWNAERKAVAITCGAEGCWFVTAADSSRPRHVPACPVEAFDTTGCGDVFHGAYAAMLARRLPVEECLRRASAAAALKASRPGIPEGVPSLRQVEQFLRASSR